MSRGSREIDFEPTDRQSGNDAGSLSRSHAGSGAAEADEQRKDSRAARSGTGGLSSPTEADVVAELASMIDSATVDKPTVSEFISRLEGRGVEVHPSIQSNGRLNGFSYRWKGRTIKGSSIGREYTPAGLQRRKGVSYEPERDDSALRRAAERLRIPEPAARVRNDRNPLERDARRMNRPSGLSRDQEEALMEIGRFRTVAKEDVARYQYGGDTAGLERDIRVLRDRGLVDLRSIPGLHKARSGAVLVLRKEGRHLASGIAQSRDESKAEQRFYSGFVKPAEVRHDAAIYRMYQAERGRIEGGGGRVRRVVLDYELKQKMYSEMNKRDGSGAKQSLARKEEIAHQIGLAVVDERVVFPDLRIEYETADHEPGRVDLELASEHYKTGEVMQKHAAGLRIYGPADAPRSPALHDPGIVAGLISF